jgi:hypothetical protein
VLTLDETPTETSLGSSREAVLVLLAVLVGSVLLERRSLSGRLEVLEANFALDALRGDVLCMCVSLLSKAWNVFPHSARGERGKRRRVCKSKSKKKNVRI